MICRQRETASWAQSRIFTEMPRCAKQLVCRQLWPFYICRLGDLGVTAEALMQAETVHLGITAHAPTHVQSSSNGDGAKLSVSGLPLPVDAQGSLVDLGSNSPEGKDGSLHDRGFSTEGPELSNTL